MQQIYYIGGSPCSGKSTTAERMEKEFDIYYHKVDETLFYKRKKAEEDKKPYSTKANHMTSDEIWMRDPKLQSEEELEIYREIFEYIMEELNSLPSDKPIIAEGAAFLPEMMKLAEIDRKHYICVIPEKNFQITHYRKRTWVPMMLKDCSEKEKAFENWMNRDAIFAKEVYQQCIEHGYECWITDGSRTEDDLYRRVCEVFELSIHPEW